MLLNRMIVPGKSETFCSLIIVVTKPSLSIIHSGSEDEDKFNPATLTYSLVCA